MRRQLKVAGPPATVTWWLYLLACKDGRTYAGITIDVNARFRVHASGKGSKFTRANPPLAILGAQQFATKSAALQAEAALKKLQRTEKLLWASQWPHAVNAHPVREPPSAPAGRGP
jgi:putative endonuclease